MNQTQLPVKIFYYPFSDQKWRWNALFLVCVASKTRIWLIQSCLPSFFTFSLQIKGLNHVKSINKMHESESLRPGDFENSYSITGITPSCLPKIFHISVSNQRSTSSGIHFKKTSLDGRRSFSVCDFENSNNLARMWVKPNCFLKSFISFQTKIDDATQIY